MYDVEWLPEAIFRVRLAGVMDNRQMASFTREVHEVLGRKPQPTFAGLCDITDLLIQPCDVVLRLKELLDHVRAAGMRRGAVVVTSALLEMQANRAVDPSRTMFVATPAQGMAWIDAMRTADLALAA